MNIELDQSEDKEVNSKTLAMILIGSIIWLIVLMPMLGQYLGVKEIIKEHFKIELIK